MIGKQAPSFSCTAVWADKKQENFSLKDVTTDYKLLFFYPADFTFVCPTEIHALQDKLSEFEKRGVTVLAVSTDGADIHEKWLKTPKKEGGVEGITFALLADADKTMSFDYGVYDEIEKVALRGAFLLDKNNVVQVATVHNLPLGRSVDELLRVVDALKFSEQHGKVCPANWSEGKPALETTQESVKNYFAK